MQLRHCPDDKYAQAEASRGEVPAWMLETLRLNPEYCGWGPGEDYMPAPKPGNGHGWGSSLEFPEWDGKWGLDDLNVVANYYFHANRDEKKCPDCDASGYSPKAKEVSDTFYAHSCPPGVKPWNAAITKDEAAALVANGRTHLGTTAQEINQNARGHDAINRMVLIEARCKRLGIEPILCPTCDGNGSVIDSESAELRFTAWILHPRKGAARGVTWRHIQPEQVREICAWLAEGAKQNADRFSRAVAEASK